ncbi:hypothetical protein CKO23_23445 [Thiocystis violacea]|nr:hypothetical protein [Thiocystis violacea]
MGSGVTKLIALVTELDATRLTVVPHQRSPASGGSAPRVGHKPTLTHPFQDGRIRPTSDMARDVTSAAV